MPSPEENRSAATTEAAAERASWSPTEILAAAFTLALFLSIAAAQILGGILIVAAARKLILEPEIRRAAAGRAWSGTGLVMAGIASIALINSGPRGVLETLLQSWHLLLLPAGWTLAPRLRSGRIAAALIAGAAIAAGAFLFQHLAEDPMWEGRYGYHKSPYVFAYLLVAPWLLLLRVPGTVPVRVLQGMLLAAILLVQSRGIIVSAAVASAFFVLAGALGARSSRLVSARNLLRTSLALMIALAVVVALTWDRWLYAPSIEHRLQIWSQVLTEIREHPVMGNGFESFAADPDKAPAQFRADMTNQTNIHSGYLALLHATGGLGFALVAGATLLLWRAVGSREPFKAPSYPRAILVCLGTASLSDRGPFITLLALQTWWLVGIFATVSPSIPPLEFRRWPRAVTAFLLVLVLGLAVDVIRTMTVYREVRPRVAAAALNGLEHVPSGLRVAETAVNDALTAQGLPIVGNNVDSSFRTYEGGYLQAMTVVEMPAYAGAVLGNTVLRFRVHAIAWNETDAEGRFVARVR